MDFDSARHRFNAQQHSKRPDDYKILKVTFCGALVVITPHTDFLPNSLSAADHCIKLLNLISARWLCLIYSVLPEANLVSKILMRWLPQSTQPAVEHI